MPASTDKSPSDNQYRKSYWLCLALLTAAAAALRFYKLSEWSYWSDEAFTISDSNAFYEKDPGRLPEHALSFRLYGAWFALARSFGWQVDEWVARAFPAALGALGVFLTSWLGARPAGRKAALFAGALVAVSPFHLYWSQNARSYALEVTLAIPAGLILGSAMLTGKIREFLLGFLLLAAAAFAHPTALAIAPGLVVFGILSKGFSRETGGFSWSRVPWKWIAGASIAIVAMILLTPLRRSIWVHFMVKSGASPALFVSTCAYYFKPALLAAAAALAIRGIARGDRRTLFFAFAGFGPIVSGFVASCFVRANSQYVLAALPFLALLIGRECLHLAWTAATGARLAAAALALAVFSDLAGGAYLYFTIEEGHRAKWREACAYVWRERAPGDVIAATQATVVECYLNPSNPLPRRIRESLYLNPYEPVKFEVVPRLGRRAWFLILDVDLDEWRKEEKHRFLEFLREQCRSVADWPLTFGGKNQTLRIWRYDPP